MKLTKAREAKIVATLSKRAQKLFHRIKDEGRFYRSFRVDTPKAMTELVEAGLVGESGRVNVVIRCYVPRRGFKPFRMEEWLR